MHLIGANPRAPISGLGRLSAVSNHFIGNEPLAWHTQVPTYASMLERELYPGVNLVYHGNQGGQLEYDFRVAPGIDPSVIRLAFEGQRGLSVDPAGNLVVRLPRGELVQPRPFAYQIIDGSRRTAEVSYALSGNQVRLAMGSYDRSRPLVIDPVISYSTYIGGSDFDEINRISVDRFGNTYLFGDTVSADFPLKNCLFCTFKGGTEDNTDDFVAKLNRDGTALIWSTYLGGTGDDEAEGLAIDHAGNVYVAGPTLSSDFPTTPGAFQETAPGGDHDGFVTKIDPAGGRLVFSTYLGGSGHDAAITPVVDGAGDVYVTGDTNSQDLPVTPGAFQTRNHGGDCTIFNEFDPGDCGEGGGLDMFVAELNPAGSALRYLTYLGGTGDEVGLGLDVDRWGNAYVAFETTSTDYPVTAGAFQPAFAGGDGTDGVYSDNVVTKLNPTGSRLVYSTYLGDGRRLLRIPMPPGHRRTGPRVPGVGYGLDRLPDHDGRVPDGQQRGIRRNAHKVEHPGHRARVLDLPRGKRRRSDRPPPRDRGPAERGRLRRRVHGLDGLPDDASHPGFIRRGHGRDRQRVRPDGLEAAVLYLPGRQRRGGRRHSPRRGG